MGAELPPGPTCEMQEMVEVSKETCGKPLWGLCFLKKLTLTPKFLKSGRWHIKPHILDPLEKRESEKPTTPGPTCGLPLGWAGASRLPSSPWAYPLF